MTNRFRLATALLAVGLCECLALLFTGGAAAAGPPYSMTVSTAPTTSVSCNGIACSPTADGANLNVTDLVDDLESGSIVVGGTSDTGTITIENSINGGVTSNALSFAPSAGDVVIDDTTDSGDTATVTAGEVETDAPLSGPATGSSSLTIDGNAVFTGTTGTLDNLDVTGTTYTDAPIDTSGTQTYTGQLSMDANMTLTASTLSANGGISGSDNNLTVAGNATLAGGVSDLYGLTVTGTANLSGTITTNAAQTYEGAVQLDADTTTTGSSETFDSTVDSPGTAFALTAGGPATFEGVVGGTNPLSNLTASSTATLTGDVTTGGVQTYDGAVQLGADTTTTSTGNDAITFSGTIDGAHALNIATTGTVGLAKPVGATTPLASLTAGTEDGGTGGPTELGASVSSDSVTTTGDQNYDQDVTLDANTTIGVGDSDEVTFNYPVSGNQVLTMAGPGIMYLGSADAYKSTAVTGGTLAFSNGALGSGPVTVSGGTLMWWAQAAPVDDPSVQGLTVGSAGATFDTNSYNVSLANAVGGSGTITKTASGTLTLASTAGEVYGGGVVVQGGNLDVPHFIETPVTVDSGSTLDLSGQIDAAVALESNGTLDCEDGWLEGSFVNNGGITIGAPASPSAVSAQLQSNHALVSFTPGAANCNPVSYTVRASDGQTASATGSPFAFTGLPPGTPETFTVIATNPAGSSAASSISNSVTPAAAPAVTLSAPVKDATYTIGQVVKANYSCQEGAGGPGISTCVGTLPNGSALDTQTLGAHTFTVTATSADGQTAAITVVYHVARPPNKFQIKSFKVNSAGTVRVVITVPGAGKAILSVLQLGRDKSLVHKGLTSTRAQTLRATLKLPAKDAKKLRGKKGVVVISFTPKNGLQRTVTKTIRL